MESSEKNAIYDRLLAISMRVDSKNIPDPRYINEKIGQCHVFIEEVEHFYIRVSKEISVIQTSLNNATAAYEHSRDDKISNVPEIKNLPSTKDREARANNLLRKELDEIKSYQNELSDLENIHKAINLKLKNLSRLNADIKAQQRLMESQMRIGTPNVNSAAAKSLAEEFGKSMMGKDVFEGMETQATEETVIDPTVPLDVNNLLQTDEEMILGAVEEATQEAAEAEAEEEENTPEQGSDPEDDLQQFLPDSTPSESSESTEVDLDRALEPETLSESIVVPPIQPTGGAAPESKTENEPEVIKAQVSTAAKDPNDIDIDALLSQFK
jgi:hypothetical protein